VPQRRKTRAEAQARTRADLLEAAARVFKRRGYEGASVAEIADAAGYSHGALYSNFHSKEDLFLELYEQWVARRVAEIDATWSAEHTLEERAKAAADDWLERLGADPTPFLLRLELTVRAAHDRRLRQKLATRTGAVPLAVRRLVESAIEERDAELSPIPAEEIALAFQALSLGLALEGLTDPKAVRPGLGGDLAAALSAAVRSPGSTPRDGA
jgi:AcrR family transcriptional regulator